MPEILIKWTDGEDVIAVTERQIHLPLFLWIQLESASTLSNFKLLQTVITNPFNHVYMMIHGLSINNVCQWLEGKG